MIFVWIAPVVLTLCRSTVQAQVWGESINVVINNTHSIEYVRYGGGMSWEEAYAKCGQDTSTYEQSHLLCFESRSQITSFIAEKDLENFGIWLSRKNCLDRSIQRCLSLRIIKRTGQLTWEFHNDCSQKLGFICRKFVRKKSDNLVLDQNERNSQLSCPQTLRRNISWPLAIGNTNVSMKCPKQMKGFARWFCNGTTGEWGPGEPNFANCRSVALTAMLTKIDDHLRNPRVGVVPQRSPTFFRTPVGSSQNDVIDLQSTVQELREMMRGVQTGGDVQETVTILDRVGDIFVSKAPAMTTAQKKQMALTTSNHVVNVCDQLLTKSQAWNELSPDNRTKTASTFLTAVDETGNILASSIETNKHAILTKNVVLEVVRSPGKSSGTRNERFVSQSDNSLNVVVGEETDHVIFSFYSDLRDILPAHQDVQGQKVLNSPLISANISGGQLKGKVQIRLSHFNTSFHDATCVYWDFTRQEWSESGCKVVVSTAEHTECECDHLTNFAILMDMTCASCHLDPVDRIALAVITVIGCSISIFCLAVCVVIFTYYKTLWGMRIMIHRNLCITLIIAQAILLGGLDKTGNKVVCACIAGFLHYFFLAAFCWMFLEAFHIMWLLINVFNPKRSHVIKFYIFGYGFPAVLVAINAGFKHEGYGTPQYCWLNTVDGTIWGFIGPVIGIILFNTVSLGYALYTTSRIARSKEKGPKEGLRMWVRGAAVLMPLLGITWIVGFLYVERDYVIFAYFFAALNSLQGLGIFFFHCILNQKVKEHVSRSIKNRSFLSSYGRSSTRNSKTTSTKGSSSPSRRATPKYFPDQPESQNNSPEYDDEVETPEETEQVMTFLQRPTQGERERTDTNDLYPMEVEKG